MEKERGDKMPAEEAAKMLLAFSSPDTLRPSAVVTPLMGPGRRGTLESEEFTLDGGVAGMVNGVVVATGGTVGKTARDILKM